MWGMDVWVCGCLWGESDVIDTKGGRGENDEMCGCVCGMNVWVWGCLWGEGDAVDTKGGRGENVEMCGCVWGMYAWGCSGVVDFCGACMCGYVCVCAIFGRACMCGCVCVMCV